MGVAPIFLRAETKPSILFASPTGTRYGYFDLNYLKELQERGFIVVYTNKLNELNWERIRNCHALVDDYSLCFH
tara:strand:+ start:295 stop:516 length:222 start_codon:yes stop_codon:yes gene_type:complete